MTRRRFWRLVHVITEDGAILSGALGTAILGSNLALKIIWFNGWGEIAVGIGGILFTVGRLTHAEKRGNDHE